MDDVRINRRDFVKSKIGASAALGILGGPVVNGRPLGSNDRIYIGLIGCGGRGRDLLKWASDTGLRPNAPAQVVAVADVYEKRKRLAEEAARCNGYLDYR